MCNITHSKSKRSLVDQHETLQSKISISNELPGVKEPMVNEFDQIERVVPEMLEKIDKLVSDKSVTL